MGNINDKVYLPTPMAFAALRTAMEEDAELAGGWHDNLACAALDEGIDSVTANKIATRFMKNCFGVDTKQR